MSRRGFDDGVDSDVVGGVLQNARLTPEIRCVPEKMLSLMRLYGVDGLLVPYFK